MDALHDEVESLEAILMDDVRIERAGQSNIVQLIETTVFPVTDNDEEQQYVCVTLQVLPTPDYPDESPVFKLLRPRGLDDTRLEVIRSACTEKLKESVGFPVVFDLIEVVREHLTNTGNLPSGQCVICLYGFCDTDEFTRTECYHYLHSYCLARHLNALRRNYQEEYDKLPAWLQKTAEPFQAGCPVCRDPIKDNSVSLKCAMPPTELENAPEFKVTRELRELQQRMSKLYFHQKSRGAIIDVESEGAAVISIESEEEVGYRQQRKQREEADAARKAATTASATAATTTAQIDVKPTTSGNFVTTGRLIGEATNSNYHHNRRHYRGGRRHNHHHHHHHHHHGRGERDTTTVSSHSTNATTATTGGVGTTPAAAVGKQPKAQTAAGAHAR